MRILVACEESQAVTIELRRLGHEAYSCDLEPCSGGHPEWHIQVDALELLKMMMDGKPAFACPVCRRLIIGNPVIVVTSARRRNRRGRIAWSRDGVCRECAEKEGEDHE